MITPGWIQKQREMMAGGGQIVLPPGGGALREALDEIERLRAEAVQWQAAGQASVRVALNQVWAHNDEVARLKSEIEAMREKADWYDMMHSPDPDWVREVDRLHEQLAEACELNATREGQLRGELARVAGIQAGIDKTVERAVARAVAEEREACAAIARERAQMWDRTNNSIIETSHRAEAFEIWDLIRSRGNP